MNKRVNKIITYITVSLCATATAFYFSICWYFSGLVLFPYYDAQAVKSIQLRELADNVERIQMPSPVSGIIDFWYIKHEEQAPCVVIYNHGWGEQRLQSDKFSPAFNDFKCAELRYDMRGHGRRVGESVGGGHLEKQELQALHQWLIKAKGYRENQIAWFGLSWGAATVLQAASLDSRPAFVVSDSAFQDWESAIFERGVRQYGAWVLAFKSGVNLMLKLRAGVSFYDASPLKSAPAIKVPVLLIHSQSDTATASQQSLNISRQLRSPHHFQHSDWGSDHGDDILTRPKEYQQLIKNFAAKYAPSFGQK
ncbi:alpha/beta hydrolase [Agaribacterium sp. ZY112]|uniref:alpha/beta hydrolase n=1 Tax=Agaribacterium sp. ZY112 TaxID=3233574 RepID=UPI003524FE33